MLYQPFSFLTKITRQRLKLLKSPSVQVLLLCIFSIFPFTSSAQNSNKVVVIPLSGDSLSEAQADVLDFFTYDAALDRLTIAGTAENPLNEVFFQNVNVRGASQVRQDFRTNATDIPDDFTLVEIEEESITLGAIPNNNQAVVVNAFANLDTTSPVSCPCEFRAYIIQDEGLPSAVSSPAAYLEVEAGDNDIDATISHSFAFIATERTQNYSFWVQLWSHVAGPASGLYAVDEASITVSTYGLASVGTLKLPSKALLDKASESE